MKHNNLLTSFTLLSLPMWVFAGFGVAALFFALWLKGENKKKGYGLEEPNIKK